MVGAAPGGCGGIATPRVQGLQLLGCPARAALSRARARNESDDLGSVIATTSRAGMRVLVALASFGAAAATGDQYVVGKTFMAGSVNPTSGSTGWALTSHGISENLFTVNKNGEIVGQVAESVSKVSELIWDVTLKSGYKFSDGTDVTAQAVADCLSELNSANSNAQATIGTMTVTAPSAGTVRIESTISTHIMDSVLAEWVFTVFKRDGSDYVFTGPYKVDTFVAGDYIDLVPNTHYYDSKHAERHPIKIKSYGSSDLAAAAIAGEVDVGFHLPADELVAVRAASGVQVRTFEVGYHYMCFHNIGKSSGRAINDVRVREAIDLALDRDALSQALAGGHGTRSLFPDYTPWYQEGLGVSHGDLTAAGAKLDEAGWTLDSSTGKRTKDGADLTIDLVACASVHKNRRGARPTHRLICAQVRVPPGPGDDAAGDRRRFRSGGDHGQRDHDPGRELRQHGLRRRLDGGREPPGRRGLGPAPVGPEHAAGRRSRVVPQGVLPLGRGQQPRGP